METRNMRRKASRGQKEDSQTDFSKCRYPEEGINLTYLKNRKKATVAGV